MKSIFLPLLAVACALAFAPAALAAQLMTRTLKDKPAIVLTAFGTSTRAKATYDVLEAQVRKEFPEYEIRWAFTSEVIRERVNERLAKQGSKTRFLSLQQALANLEAEGFTKAAVQPIHIFPGEEYEEVLRIVGKFPGLKIETGESLLQRWENVFEVVKILEHDFLPPEEGCNVIVAHGSPSTNVGSNIVYLGLDRYLSKHYSNVFLGGVDGVITRDDALSAVKKYPKEKVRFIALMYVAGDHIMNDIMGEKEDDKEPSWKREVEEQGIKTESVKTDHDGQTYYKGLGFFSEVNEIFIREIERSLKRL